MVYPLDCSTGPHFIAPLVLNIGKRGRSALSDYSLPTSDRRKNPVQCCVVSDFIIEFGNERTKVSLGVRSLGDLGRRLTRELGASITDAVVVITDTQVGRLYGDRVLESLSQAAFRVLQHRIDPGEASKSWAVAGEIYGFLAEHDVGRDGIIVALGGGVVSDLAGFVAATWMRGVRFVVCPTTLEADIDAAIGGKTAINIPGAKNLVGAFHQPSLVLIDPSCLNTLPPRDFRAGLAESVKHALIASSSFLAWHETHVEPILGLDEATILELIQENIRIKADIVCRDVKERTGLRAGLNFGHTIGHAIEECCGFTLRHGECVSLGMLAVCRMSRDLGLLEPSVVARVETLLTRFELPTRLVNRIEPGRILAAARHDKKVRGGAAQLVLLEGIGRPILRGDVAESVIREGYASLLR